MLRRDATTIRLSAEDVIAYDEELKSQKLSPKRSVMAHGTSQSVQAGTGNGASVDMRMGIGSSSNQNSVQQSSIYQDADRNQNSEYDETDDNIPSQFSTWIYRLWAETTSHSTRDAFTNRKER
ncbi:hypothetical protein PVL30_005590 [Lodderomyces elongisporus]|uniref:uncharacterized protein n=1 Tax=Lodderomyces elongisporus TaxID=36914 RepID=UPI002923D717|nr:uncharacterized protein PVL30_005590 [Lodderomyces elongisporus]WLF81790.1 hypothetical protein PVL30_005590 [Lodderomyces elongisporus]